MIRFIAQIVHHRQFFITHLRSNLLQHFRARDLMRQRGNYHSAVFFGPYRAHTHGAPPVFVNFTNFRTWGNDLRFGRVIRPLDDIQQLIQRRFRLLNQRNRRFRDFAQVMRRNICCHAHRNTGGAVQQDVRQTRR
ncbi:Uncharacterised protein [Salmonella enterica subsp. enterica serovar Bovismorbificans]|uniref:Uncharacterized protein n=1 Tax=Salmonella enterica subsp. enterica serovar Bovismorbificans TaxID=58097 RepID=A0A655C302_SALET|nr:Uncharacterised protein [Salmonella enterica subsp. enterica serovar Bovismorbificans]